MNTKKLFSYNKLWNLFYFGFILLMVIESLKEKKRFEI